MEEKDFEPAGLIPRSIIRTVERFRQQLRPETIALGIQEFRISRYQVRVSVRYFFILLLLPIAINWGAKNIIIKPLVGYFWNTYGTSLFLNSYQAERAFQEMRDFESQLFFEMLLSNPRSCSEPIVQNTINAKTYNTTTVDLATFSLDKNNGFLLPLESTKKKLPVTDLAIKPNKQSTLAPFSTITNQIFLETDNLKSLDIIRGSYENPVRKKERSYPPLQGGLGVVALGYGAVPCCATHQQEGATTLPLPLWGTQGGMGKKLAPGAPSSEARQEARAPLGACHAKQEGATTLPLPLWGTQRGMGKKLAPGAPSSFLPVRAPSEALASLEARHAPRGTHTRGTGGASEATSIHPLFQGGQDVLDPINTSCFQILFQEKTYLLAEIYNQQSITALSNMFGDFIMIISIFLLLRLNAPQFTILKSFLIESFYSFNDAIKCFYIILITDFLVGFHSPRGWEIVMEMLLRHLGLPENEEFILLFVGTFPVFLDTAFKYWIFRYLNKISPSTVATYHSMIE